jgi:hypothetical protein
MVKMNCYESRLTPEFEQEYLARKERVRSFYKWLKSPNAQSVISTYETIMAFNEEREKDTVMGEDFLYYYD